MTGQSDNPPTPGHIRHPGLPLDRDATDILATRLGLAAGEIDELRAAKIT